MPRLSGFEDWTSQPIYDTYRPRWWWRWRWTSWLLRKVFRRTPPQVGFLTLARPIIVPVRADLAAHARNFRVEEE